MNNLVIGSTPQSLPSDDLNLGGTSTSEKVFITSATKGGTNPVASQAIQLWIPTNAQLAGTAPATGYTGTTPPAYNAAFTTGFLGAQRPCVRFRVLAFGRVVTGTTSNFTVKMYINLTASRTAVNSTVPAAGAALATTGAVSLASLTTNWTLETWFCYDAVSQRLNGGFEASLHTTVTAYTTLSNSQTALDFNNPLNTICFVLTGTFGTGNAGNKAYVDGFYLLLD